MLRGGKPVLITLALVVMGMIAAAALAGEAGVRSHGVGQGRGLQLGHYIGKGNEGRFVEEQAQQGEDPQGAASQDAAAHSAAAQGTPNAAAPPGHQASPRPCSPTNATQVRIRAGEDGQTVVELLEPCPQQ